MSKRKLPSLAGELPKPDAFADVALHFVDEGERGCSVVIHALSQVLCTASPVFRAMLSSQMSEGITKRIDIKKDVGTSSGFQTFYSWLVPLGAVDKRLNNKRVDEVLAFSDYYQVSTLKDLCEGFLLEQSPSVQRLLQADKHGLLEQRARCLKMLARKADMDFSALKGHPGLMFELISAMQGEAKRRRTILQKELQNMDQRIRTRLRTTMQSMEEETADEESDEEEESEEEEE